MSMFCEKGYKNFISPKMVANIKEERQREIIYNRQLNYGKNIKTHIT